jgi:hypothetical protein
LGNGVGKKFDAVKHEARLRLAGQARRQGVGGNRVGTPNGNKDPKHGDPIFGGNVRKRGPGFVCGDKRRMGSGKCCGPERDLWTVAGVFDDETSPSERVRVRLGSGGKRDDRRINRDIEPSERFRVLVERH